MSDNTRMWKDQTKSVLSRHLSAGAVDLCMRYFAVVKSFDEVAQGREQLPVIAAAFSDMLTGFVGNEFYAAHHSRLGNAMVLGVKSWSDAVVVAQSAVTDEDKVRVVMGRRAFHDVATTCAMIEGKDTSLIRAELVNLQVL